MGTVAEVYVLLDQEAVYEWIIVYPACVSIALPSCKRTASQSIDVWHIELLLIYHV